MKRRTFLALPILTFAAALAEPAPPPGGDAKEKPAASGIDALEVVKIVYVPSRNGGVARKPLVYATFRYTWFSPGGVKTPDFSTQKGDTFVLPPANHQKYKVIEITSRSVVLELPDGSKKTLTLPDRTSPP